MVCNIEPGKFMNRQRLQRCAESGTPRICSCSGFPGPYVGQFEACLLLKQGEL